MELHDLLIDLVADGMSGDLRLHTVECANGHVCGYAKVLAKAEPCPISVLCNKCHEIANIWKALSRSEPGPAAPLPTKKPRKQTSAEKVTLQKVEIHVPEVQAEKKTDAVPTITASEEKRSESQIKPTNPWRKLRKLDK